MTLALIALLPIASVLVLMLAARWPAVRAGAAGLAVAIVLVFLVFPFESLDNDIVLGLAGSFAEAIFTTLTILWIILPALAIYRLQTATGAVDSMRVGLSELSSDPRVTALVVAWFFALLLEGAAGFGTSAALAAPFLVAIGMGPVAAVTAAMLGHIVGVTFGAVGTPVVPMVAASGLEPTEISGSMAIQASAVGWMVPIIVAFFVAAAYPAAPSQPIWQRVGLALGAAVLFLVPFVVFALFVGPELPTLAGAIVGGALFILLIRRRTSGPRAGAAAAVPAEAAAAPPMSLGRAMAPYLILVALVLATRLIPPLTEALRSVEITWSSGDGTFSGSFEPLYHPGTMLFLAFVLGALVQRAQLAQVGDSLVGAGRTLVPVAAALVAMLGLARLMVHSGMVDAIAEAAADAVGGAWPLLAPVVGALGTFVTGSATASNALFSDLQVATATAVGYDAAVILGSQGLGAALGNAIAPHNLIAAAAIVALAGRESEILRRTLPVVLPLVALAGVVALVIANL
jgi:lactate permease